jgi:hypothetical protein
MTPSNSAPWLGMLGQWNMEIASFYGRRLQAYAMLPVNLMLCVSPEDAIDAQEDFSATLLADYRAAAEKLMQATGGGATEAYAGALLKAQEDARNILDQARAQAQRIIAEAEARMAEPHAAEEWDRVDVKLAG